MIFRCKHCTHRLNTTIEGKPMVYCPIRKYFPNPRFVEAWGCDEYEDEQLKLFDEERRKDK